MFVAVHPKGDSDRNVEKPKRPGGSPIFLTAVSFVSRGNSLDLKG